ncbi:hypothetical protein Cgig2_001828 [Carnegiea gigantea]|uniref:EF-hand domain-containing protein n=1 Tax=Carnegiea gigantea TaxID=171969 RepID=A0A9Q1GUT6_9CARY|nr:hypothetical protein Cgig2_001828 [Carnegiea gigantea]
MQLGRSDWWDVNGAPLGLQQNFKGKSAPCPALKFLANRFASMFCCCSCHTNKYRRLDAKLERKMIELRRGHPELTRIRSINSVIMKFPQLKEDIRNLRGVFEQYDENCDGTIDGEELRKCLRELQVDLADQETNDLFHSCDVDRNGVIQFNEFIVLLCIVYLLIKPSGSADTLSRLGSPQLEATFDTFVEAFFYMDKNGDGKLNKKDLVMALTEAPWERSAGCVTKTRFKEMDRDKDGNVGFREFLFALTDWLGIESDEEMTVHKIVASNVK